MHEGADVAGISIANARVRCHERATRPALLAILLLTAGLIAQERPDFSGTWTFDQQKSMKPDANGRIVLAATSTVIGLR